jgi:hypothetical protein
VCLVVLLLSGCAVKPKESSSVAVSTDSDTAWVSSSALASPVSDQSQASPSPAVSSASPSAVASASASSTASSSTSANPDPYVNMSADQFYQNYHEATSSLDAKYRSLHSFMSGSLADQPQMMTLAANQPKRNGVLLRNSSEHLSQDGYTYTLVDSEGKKVKDIYKYGAYVTLDDVASYVYAFGDIPANYVSDKKTSPRDSLWGKYLRLNHSSFDNNTVTYPDEPDLPDAFNSANKSSGTYKYFEMDIGTTGSTLYSEGYTVGVYNNGSKIIRGGSRIVYTRFYKDGSHVDSPSDRHVFYTYSHYADFTEYLNYYQGFSLSYGFNSSASTYEAIAPLLAEF